MYYLTYRRTTHGITILYYNYNYFSVDLVHHEIFRAKVGKGNIKGNI